MEPFASIFSLSGCHLFGRNAASLRRTGVHRSGGKDIFDLTLHLGACILEILFPHDKAQRRFFWAVSRWKKE